MCLIAWDWQPGSALPLLVLANRDEFYARPTLALHAWPCGQVLAGKDEQAGGTWLGLGSQGPQFRFAAITNFRDLSLQRPDALSRGALVPEFLQSNESADVFLARLSSTAHRYNPFNLLVFDGTHLRGFESHSGRTVVCAPGVGAVSNAGFNTPWPKLLQLKQAVAALDTQEHPPVQRLLQLLADQTPVADADLPATGLALQRERALAPVFVRTPDYGTRASTVVSVHSHRAEIFEQNFDASGPTGFQQLSTSIPSAQTDFARFWRGN
jgi:hypothetical protein